MRLTGSSRLQIASRLLPVTGSLGSKSWAKEGCSRKRRRGSEVDSSSSICPRTALVSHCSARLKSGERGGIAARPPVAAGPLFLPRPLLHAREGTGCIGIDHLLQRVPDPPVRHEPRVEHLGQVLARQVDGLAAGVALLAGQRLADIANKEGPEIEPERACCRTSSRTCFSPTTRPPARRAARLPHRRCRCGRSGKAIARRGNTSVTRRTRKTPR